MPITETNTVVYEYPLPKMGVNLFTNKLEMSYEEYLVTQNCLYKNGLKKRGGQSKFETDEVTAGKKVTGLYKFYYGTNNKKLIAVSGTKIKYHDGSTWQPIDAAVGQSQTDGLQTFLTAWGATGKCYIANGTDTPIAYDGTTAAAFSSFAAANIPSDAIQFLPYQDRLLVIETSNEGTLRWSGANVDGSVLGQDWETVDNCGVKPDTKLYGMIHHSVTNSSAGIEAQVLLAGANGMYLFAGTDLRPPFTTGNYTIYSLSIKTGCNAPRTMVWTPVGTIFLGIDKQVYLLQFNSSVPIPIGDKIRSNYSEYEGIEDIPSDQIQNACAVYHDGYYILAVTKNGGTINTNQWWLDVRRLYQDQNKLWGPWYGPMTGQKISCFAVQNGPGDGGELLGGEADAAAGSYVYLLNQKNVYSDNGETIHVKFQTFYSPLTNKFISKNFLALELIMLNIPGSMVLNIFDIEGVISVSTNIILAGNVNSWGDFFWGEQYWSVLFPTKIIINIAPVANVRFLSLQLEDNSTNNLEIYSIAVRIQEKGRIFEN